MSSAEKASPSDSVVFQPAKLGPITLRNRVIKAATFEARSPRRKVTDDLIDFHRQVAAGGVGMTTVAYCAVSREGSTDGKTIVMTEDAVPGLRELTDAVHAEGAAISAQIGHAGPVANPLGTKAPPLAPSRIKSATLRPAKPCTEADLTRVTDDFRNATQRAVDAGFDAVEVHLGHNYLLSSFLSPKLNKRTDKWGGSVENRSRFPREVLKVVREVAGDKIAVTAKFNMTDGVDGGLWLDQSLPIAKLIEADGSVDALELTGGSSLANPMYLFRGDAPTAEMAATLPPVVRTGFKWFIAPSLMQEYPFEEAFFLPMARQFKAALDLPLILLGGINRLDTMESAIHEGFEFVAMARALLREPDLLRRMQAGEATDSLCIHCNKCMPLTFSRTRCVLVEEPAAPAAPA